MWGLKKAINSINLVLKRKRGKYKHLEKVGE